MTSTFFCKTNWAIQVFTKTRSVSSEVLLKTVRLIIYNLSAFFKRSISRAHLLLFELSIWVVRTLDLHLSCTNDFVSWYRYAHEQSRQSLPRAKPRSGRVRRNWGFEYQKKRNYCQFTTSMGFANTKTHASSLGLILREALKNVQPLAGHQDHTQLSSLKWSQTPRGELLCLLKVLAFVIICFGAQTQSKWKLHLKESSRWGAMAIKRFFLLTFFENITCMNLDWSKTWKLKSVIICKKQKIS